MAFRANSNSIKIDVSVDEKVLQDGLKYGPQLIGSIDQGTSSTRFLLFTPQGMIGASAQMEHTQIFPAGADKVGWHEHDPIEIWNNTKDCINAVADALKKKEIKLADRPIVSVGITNQRETTVAWNDETGEPYHNAIVWDDLRTTDIAKKIADGDTNRLRPKSGLPLASYFAGTKVKWLLDNVPSISQELNDPQRARQVRFGTIDTWLVYQLTGHKSAYKNAVNRGGLFVTDVSNASRWLFLNLDTISWDKELVDTVCAPHDVPIATALPKVCPSSHVFGKCTTDAGVSCLENVPVASILGDQQAALFGQCAFNPGEAKCTYGTGLFLMKNTGEKKVHSTHGMLTTIAYQLGDEGNVHYALEGSVSHSGSTIQWLRDQINIIDSARDSEKLAAMTSNNEGLYLVPAFAGLFAPHWRSDARACIVGMTATHHKGHICRAALEAAAYQAREVFDAISADSNYTLTSLNVDGGATANKLLMQFQADIVGVPVVKPKVLETTAMGAAFAAGLAVGIWKDVDEIRKLWAVQETFQPTMSEADRQKNWNGWNKAVSRSLGWVEDDGVEDTVKGETSAKTGDAPATDTSIATFGPLSMILASAAALAGGFFLGQRKK